MSRMRKVTQLLPEHEVIAENISNYECLSEKVNSARKLKFHTED